MEATLNMEPFQDKKEVLSLLKSHGFAVNKIGGDKVRVKGNFKELRAVKIHLEKLMATKAHRSSSSSGKESGSGLASSLDCKETSPPDQQGSVRPRDELIVVDRDVFSYAEEFRRKDLDEALKGPVSMCSEKTGESVTITLSGKNSREARSKVEHLLADLNKFLRTQDVLLSNLSPQGACLLQKMEKSGNISGSNLVLLIGDRVHIIGPSKESFELKQQLLVDRTERNGKSSERHRRRTRSLSLRQLFRRKSRRDVREVFHPAAGEAAVPAGASAARRQSGPQRARRSSETQKRKKAERLEDGEQEVCSPKQRKSFFGRFFSFFRKS